jgi:hypothetical protein
MLERYRTLGAMLALREFTVADLALYSGVKESTVRTILARESQYVQRTLAVPSGKPGGQPLAYKLRSNAEQNLTEVLRELEAIGAKPPVADRSTGDGAGSPPAALIAAEDILLRQLPQCRTQAERDQLVELAAADYEDARLEVNRSKPQVPTLAVPGQDREIAAHMQVVDLLLRFSSTERSVLAPSLSPDQTQEEYRLDDNPVTSTQFADDLKNLHDDLHRLLTDMPELQDKRLLPDLFDRVGTSPLGHSLWRDTDTSEAFPSPRVLLLGIGGEATANVTRFVKDVLRSRNVSFFEQVSEDANALSHTPNQEPRECTAFLLTVRAGDEVGREALAHASEMYGALRRFVVIGDRYDDDLSNHVNALQGRYLSFQGLQPPGLMGALGAAMTEAPSQPLWRPAPFPGFSDPWAQRSR